MTAARAAAAPVRGQTLLLERLDPSLVRRLSSNGSRGKNHWPTTNARNRVMTSVYTLARKAGWQRFTAPVVVTFRWIVPDRRARDIDNLAGNGIVKATLDALKDTDKRQGWIVDDSSKYVVEVRTELEYEKGRRALVVTLEPAT